jgi:hypothetical protein
MGSPLPAVIGEELGLGDHVAYFFKSSGAARVRNSVYRPGAQNRERCVYIAHENTLSRSVSVPS